MGDPTLNEVLAARGLTTRPTAHHRKDILRDGVVVLADATAGEVWAWLAPIVEADAVDQLELSW